MKVEKYIEKMGWTRVEAAKRFDVSRVSLNNYILGRVTPRVTTAARISKVCKNKVNRKDFV
jgi:DNA-binding XRE family transcriptional regulator